MARRRKKRPGPGGQGGAAPDGAQAAAPAEPQEEGGGSDLSRSELASIAQAVASDRFALDERKRQQIAQAVFDLATNEKKGSIRERLAAARVAVQLMKADAEGTRGGAPEGAAEAIDWARLSDEDVQDLERIAGKLA